MAFVKQTLRTLCLWSVCNKRIGNHGQCTVATTDSSYYVTS